MWAGGRYLPPAHCPDKDFEQQFGSMAAADHESPANPGDIAGIGEFSKRR
jgi:hypothetical protein